MSSSADRRDFLKASAALAGTAAAASFSGAFAAGNDTIKVGVIGCGGRGTRAILNILEAEAAINGKNGKVEIVALGDVFKNKAQGTARTITNRKSKDYGAYVDYVKVTPETTFDGLDAYQKVLNAGVDLVILATPPGFRPIHLEAAIRANKHIFCEKPVAVDAAGARKVFGLVDESKSKDLAIVAGTQRRHQKGYIETIQKIHDGAIGDVTAARCSWNGGGIWFRERQPGMSDAEYQINNWYHYLWVCGDHIVEQHVHNLDVINWVMQDQGPPVKAVGMGGRAARPGGPNGDPNKFGQIWDHYAVEYEYKNGVKMFSYCRHIPGDNDISETVFGAKGTSRVNNYLINNREAGSDARDPYVQEHIDLLNSIRAGKPLNELKSVAEATFTAILGRNAAYACKTLKWSDALAANEDLMPKNLTLASALDAAPAATPGSWRLPPKA